MIRLSNWITRIEIPLIVSVFVFLMIFGSEVIGDKQKEKQRVRVIYDKAPLKTEFGEIECPEGTVFTIQKKGKTKLKVKGEIYNSSISGIISVYAVESISDDEDSDVGDMNKAPWDSNEIYDESDEDSNNTIKYLGFFRTDAFFKALYTAVKDHYVFSNRLTQDIVLKQKLIKVDSVTQLKKLKQGDIVRLQGVLFSRPEFAIVKLKDETYGKSRKVLLLGETYLDTDDDPVQPDFDGYAEYRPDLSSIKLSAKVSAIFQRMPEKHVFLTESDFFNAVKKGFSFRKSCDKCNGTGMKPGTEQECKYCHGDGYLSPVLTSLEIDQDLK